MSEVLIPKAICAHCGQEFERNIKHRKYCGSIDCDRSRNNYTTKLWYWEDPQKAREAAKRWRDEHAEEFKAYRAKSGRRVCVICGASRNRADAPREGFVCGECKVAVARESRMVPCLDCGKAVLAPRQWCRECYGASVDLAADLMVSRQRATQLVQAMAKRLSKAGILLLPKKDVISLVRVERLGEPIPEDLQEIIQAARVVQGTVDEPSVRRPAIPTMTPEEEEAWVEAMRGGI